MSPIWRRTGASADGEAGDPVVARALSSMDPAAADPNYWTRFQSWTVTAAGPELARRRLMADLTMGDVLVGWARAVVPTAALAAVVALLLLLRPSEPNQGLLATSSVEELLVAGMGRATIPEALGDGEGTAWVTFASEGF